MTNCCMQTCVSCHFPLPLATATCTMCGKPQTEPEVYPLEFAVTMEGIPCMWPTPRQLNSLNHNRLTPQEKGEKYEY